MFFSDFNSASPMNSTLESMQVNPGGVTVYNDLAMFGFFGSGAQYPGLYSYGRKMRNRPFSFNYDYRLARTIGGSTISEIGAVWTAHTNFFASWKTVDGSTTEYGVDMLSTSTRASARYEGLEFSAGRSYIKRQYISAKFVMEPLPSGSSVNMIYKTNRGSWRYAQLPDGTSTYSIQGSSEADFIINDNGRIMEIGAELTPSAGDELTGGTPEIVTIITAVQESDKFY